MKTVLIVEDEKMIRQGIKTMIQRSGVPIEIIMECGNGQMALEILKSQEVDVMFTDIRMPKMDGIELVKAMQDLPHKPLTVAISGYDDFSYAVELLRMGVKDYILKPVDRDKIVETLKRLEQMVSESKESDQEVRSIGYQQLKYLVSSDNITAGEKEILIGKYEDTFFKSEYLVLCTNNTTKENEEDSSYIYLGDIEDHELYIIDKNDEEMFIRKKIRGRHVGVSEPHEGLGGLKDAYYEALNARKQSFWSQKNIVNYVEQDDEKNAEISSIRRKNIGEPEPDDNTMKQIAQMLGTDKAEDALSILERSLNSVYVGNYNLDRFEQNLFNLFSQIQITYKNVIKDEKEEMNKFTHIYRYNDVSVYEEEVLNYMHKLVQTINSQFDDYKNKQKIQMAIGYIQDNYDKDLNMAVVSNHISMNYSLFSYVFKQYTGSNFVNYLKDIRMREAKKLLEETDLRIVEISQKIGYENEKHFMKTFKSVCGVSPTEYRKNMQFKE